MIHILEIDNWHPVSINKLLGTHPCKRSKLKRRDSDTVRVFAVSRNIPRALGKRGVTVIFRGLKGDVDNRIKSLLDSLVVCGLLIDDNQQFLELGPIHAERGAASTVIILEDIEDTEPHWPVRAAPTFPDSSEPDPAYLRSSMGYPPEEYMDELEDIEDHP